MKKNVMTGKRRHRLSALLAAVVLITALMVQAVSAGPGVCLEEVRAARIDRGSVQTESASGESGSSPASGKTARPSSTEEDPPAGETGSGDQDKSSAGGETAGPSSGEEDPSAGESDSGSAGGETARPSSGEEDPSTSGTGSGPAAGDTDKETDPEESGGDSPAGREGDRPSDTGGDQAGTGKSGGPDTEEEHATSPSVKEPSDQEPSDKEAAEKKPSEKEPSEKEPSGGGPSEKGPSKEEAEPVPESGAKTRETEEGTGSTEDKEPEKTGEGPVPKKAAASKEGAAAADDTASAAEKAGSAAAANTANTAAAAEPVQEEWMTIEEFNQAYESVTSGARRAAASTLEGAQIISKSSEIDYEALGIGTDQSGYPGHTTPINVRDRDGNEYVGICAVPNDRGWARWTVLPNVTRVTDAVMIKLYYYTMLDNYGKDLASSRGFGNAGKVAIAACHEAMSMRYAELAGIEYDRPNLSSGMRSLVSAYRSGAAAKALPDQNKVFVYISARTQSDGHWMQAYVLGRVQEDEPASMVLTKACSDPDMMYEYSSYSLYETAQGDKVRFRVYTDKACTKPARVYSDANKTNEISSIPVGNSGMSGNWNRAVFYLDPGTYYLKEANVPKGYMPQEEPFGPFTLAEGKGKNIRVENTPRYVQIGVYKKDGKTGKGLKGAKFGFYSTIEDARNNAKPEGIFTTGEDGRSNHLSALADKIYYVREIQAPDGYQPISGVRALAPAKSFTSVNWTEILNEVVDKGRIRIKKTSADPGADQAPYSLAGAEYTLYDSEGKAAGTLKTGSDGISNELTVLCGKYTLKETKASPGFELDGKTHTVTVTADRLVTVDSVEPPKKGRVMVRKASADPKASESPYSLAGAEYTLYDSSGKAAGTLKTGSDGRSGELTVLCGKYTLKETKASPGFELDGKTHVVTVPEDKLVTVDSVEPPKKGRVMVRKASADPKASESPYSLAGAEYTLYDSSGKAAGTLKTGSDGRSNELTVLCGKYTLKETKASPGFELDVRTHSLTVTADQVTRQESVEPPKKGKITLKKHSSMEKDKKEPDTMPIEGAVYSLYKTEEDAREGRSAAGTFVVGADGTANVIEVLAGKTYYVRETRTPEGYLPDETIHRAEVDSFTEVVTVVSEDPLIFGGVRVCKLDLETGGASPLGGASLAGAVFRIYNDGERSIYARDKKVLPGAEALTLETDENGLARTGVRDLSYGTYRIAEITPPEGYTMNGTREVRFSLREDGTVVDLTGNEDTSIKDQVMRGDFSIRKLDAYTQKKMAGVTFEVTALDAAGREIEKHSFTTDRNGFFDSTAAWAYAQKNRSGEDPAGQESGRKEPADATGEETGQTEPADASTEQAGQDQTGAGPDTKERSRLWFGTGTEPVDSLGALPYGDYRIEEIEGPGNRGRKMYSDHFSVWSDRQVITLGNIENTQKPVLETELADEDGDHFADRSGMVTLTDTVTYGGMEEYIGREVLFRGVIYVKETGQPLTIDGRRVEASRTKKILSPAGTVALRFHFDGTKAEGMTLVCYEYASDPAAEKPGQEGGPGAAAGDPGQGPDTGSGGQEPPQEPGAGSTERDPQGEGTGGAGAEPAQEEAVIASHTDINDEAQTVRLVLVETEAEDSLTGMRIGPASEGAVTVDHVTCRGLIPGCHYLVTGRLVDKKDGRTLKDAAGEEVTAKASFKAEAAEQTIDLTFTYDASLLEGTTVVAFEQLYYKGDREPEKPEEPGGDPPVAVHEDPEDEDQSIHYPKIRTFASAGDRETRSLTAGGTLTVCDRVTWSNLLPGLPCLLRGCLMRKDTGEAFEVDGKAVTAEASFVPKTADGEGVLRFRFDSSSLAKEMETDQARAGATGAAEKWSLRIVAFEELYLTGKPEEETGENKDGQPGNDPEKTPEKTPEKNPEEERILLAVHKDLEDPDQTVLVREPERPEEPEKPDQPEKPEEPEKPAKPEKPDQPEEPHKADEPDRPSGPDREKATEETEKTGRRKRTPASPETVRLSGGGSGGGGARTGDETRVGGLLALLLLSAAAAGTILYKNRKK